MSPTRLGNVHVSDIGKLQEARKDLEDELGFHVTSSLGRDLRLVAHPKSQADRDRVPATYRGFVVEAREPR